MRTIENICKLQKIIFNNRFLNLRKECMLSKFVAYSYGVDMKVLESSENYLESILMLKRQKGYVRSKDIADMLGFSKASVSVAMKNLRENDFITMGSDNLIELTSKGKKIAAKMYGRHVLLTNVLTKLGVPEDIAAADACKIEHIVSEETVAAIRKYANKDK